MRWQTPLLFEHRTIRRFVILPVKIRNEIRWLEWVTILQIYEDNAFGCGWRNKKFLED